ncbi:MAG: ATP-binding protein [Usitatibacter sp.]
MQDESAVTTFLFTDIEGSTRLWEEEPVRMRSALEHHDAIARLAVKNHHGEVVKMTGDGIHAAFHDPLDAIGATLELQQALADAANADGIRLQVRCGIHAGTPQRRDDDFFGTAVNRAARIMSAAHGGQMLLSEAVMRMLDGRLPVGVGLRDLGSVRLRDLGSPERIFQLVHPALRNDFPALRSLEETPNNLPHEVTSFIGREHELARAGELLAQGRLLTVIGMGGLGKTRLAIHLAAEAMDDYPDGVWFVELAPLRDPRGVVQAVASVLGVKEEVGRTVAESLARHVKDRTLLLVLDNCEHLVQACAELSRQLLSAGPHLKILATSREPLHITGETTFALAALAVPDLRLPFEPGALARNDAVRLFVERAVAAQPDFEFTERDAAAIAAICHRLDGIPLALELAAARVRVLSVQKIAERLTDRFKLLKGGDPTMLPRLQTLRALIDWSHDLLSEGERVLFRQLAVFAGGFTVEAAEAVCLCGDDIIDLLGRLVDKSLVIRDAQAERYKLLETVRQYAQERLDESGTGDGVRQRHLEFYVSLAASAKQGLMGSDQSAWLARLDQERENFLSAHAFADVAKDGGQLGLQLANGIKLYWSNRGLIELGHRVTLEALARPGAKQRNFARCRGLFDLGQFRYLVGRYAEARECLEESLAIARELGDRKAIAAVLQPLGLAAFGQGDLGVARDHLEEALSLANERGDKREVSAAASALGQLYRVAGKAEQAQPLFRKVVAIAREQEDAETIAIGLLNLAMLGVAGGEPVAAAGMLREALDIAMRLDSRRVGQSVIEVCAGLAASRQDSAFAAHLYGAAEAHALRTALRRDPADEAFLAPLIAQARAALGGTGFAAAETEGRARAYEDAIVEARDRLATYR